MLIRLNQLRSRVQERGIPVFNSPGANANAVKELVMCSLLLASRGIVQVRIISVTVVMLAG
eukprot:SAG11_NODE_13_length_26388_cov_67.360341_10_plen_61_part_00